MTSPIFSRPFSVTVPGKWVLAGEHSVLRGCPAIALPHPQFALSLEFTPMDSAALTTEPDVLKTVMDPLLEKALRRQQVPAAVRPRGTLRISSTIPLGSGLGSSAALCVATARWLAEELAIPAEKIQAFATELEDSFHGKSSGMDIATCLAAKPILYQRGERVLDLPVKTLPRFTFVDSGYRCSTRECILKVEEWMAKNAAQAFQVDQQMARAVTLAREGLVAGNLDPIRESMDLSWRCYEIWGLLPPPAAALREDLLRQGALSVRLTGAGLGGFLVALWN